MIARPNRAKLALLLLCVLASAMIPSAVAATAAEVTLADWSDSLSQPTNTPNAPDWLEPLGLNIVDLVGFVPESDLAGAVISYTPGYGILRYKSGSRNGNTVMVTATAYRVSSGAVHGTARCLPAWARARAWMRWDRPRRPPQYVFTPPKGSR